MKRRKLSWTLVALAAALLVAQFVLVKNGLVAALLAAAAAASVVGLNVRRLSSAGLFLTSLLCCLALAEALVPVFLGGPEDKTPVRYSATYWGRGDLGNQANEGRFPTSRLGLDGVPIYEVVYSIGSDHFRITPASVAGAPRRVNFLGCSVAFGEGLQDDQTLPNRFAQLLAGVEAKNYAFSGYGPQQALAILQSDRDTKGQVNFFLTAPWHALRSACKPLWTLGSPRYALAGDRQLRRAGVCGDAGGWLPPLAARFLWRSAVFRSVRDLLTSRVSDADIELYLAVVKEMAQTSRSRGQHFALGFLKADESFFKGTSYTNQRLAAELAARVDDLIDVTFAERAEAIPRRYYLHDLDRHPSAEANLARAKLLADRLGPHLGTGAVPGAAKSP